MRSRRLAGAAVSFGLHAAAIAGGLAIARVVPPPPLLVELADGIQLEGAPVGAGGGPSGASGPGASAPPAARPAPGSAPPRSPRSRAIDGAAARGGPGRVDDGPRRPEPAGEERPTSGVEVAPPPAGPSPARVETEAAPAPPIAPVPAPPDPPPVTSRAGPGPAVHPGPPAGDGGGRSAPAPSSSGSAREGGGSGAPGGPSAPGAPSDGPGGSIGRPGGAGGQVPAPGSGGPGEGRGAGVALAPGRAGGATAAEYGSYLLAFRRRVQEALSYPMSARRRRLEGAVELEVLIEPTGRVAHVRVLASSSHADLDEAAVDAVRSVAPQPLPDHVPRRAIRVRLPLVFRLQ